MHKCIYTHTHTLIHICMHTQTYTHTQSHVLTVQGPGLGLYSVTPFSEAAPYSAIFQCSQPAPGPGHPLSASPASSLEVGTASGKCDSAEFTQHRLVLLCAPSWATWMFCLLGDTKGKSRLLCQRSWAGYHFKTLVPCDTSLVSVPQAY